MSHAVSTSQLVEFLLPHADRVEVDVDAKHVWEYQRRFRTAFFGTAAGRYQFDWEALAQGIVPSLQGGKASTAFLDAFSEAGALVVTQAIGKEPLILIEGAHRSFPSAVLAWDDDLYVTSSSFEWCFVRTHEEPQLGPYFVTGQANAGDQ